MNRREWLKTSAVSACTVGILKPNTFGCAPNSARRIVDTHTHFYDPRRAEGVPWPDKNSPLYRSVLPKDWQAVALPHGVNQTVVVEASPWLEDNQWILDLASNEPSIIGFVGNLAPHEPEFEKNLERFASNKKYVGIRIAGDWPKRIQDSSFLRGVGQLSDRGLQLDVNGGPDMLDTVDVLAKRFTSLRIVVDHCGGVGDPTTISDKWRSTMHALGKHTNVFCKVSALLEQSKAAREKFGTAPRDLDYYRPVLDYVWDCFGEDRVIYGSNWPVCEIGGQYSDQFKIVDQFFSEKGAAVAEKYFWKNASLAYRWAE